MRIGKKTTSPLATLRCSFGKERVKWVQANASRYLCACDPVLIDDGTAERYRRILCNVALKGRYRCVQTQNFAQDMVEHCKRVEFVHCGCIMRELNELGT